MRLVRLTVMSRTALDVLGRRLWPFHSAISRIAGGEIRSRHHLDAKHGKPLLSGNLHLGEEPHEPGRSA